MPARQNPFYQFRNPGIGQAFNGLASLFAQQNPDARAQSMIAENEAQARASDALAGYRGEQSRGLRDKNDAMTANPQALAELLMSGGVLRDDPLRANPDFAPMPPTDFSLTAPAQTGPISSVFMPSNTAQDKMAAALQEATIRGLKLDDVLKAAGISEYQRRAFGATPDTALAAGPFVGLNPNQNTALTPGRQDAISARDATEDLTKQGTVNATNLERERIQQGGANARQQFSTLNAPVSAGNNADVVVSAARGKALGIEPDAEGRYVVRGRTTVGTGQDQQPGSLGGDAVAGRTKPASGTGAGAKPLRFETAQIKAVNSLIESGGTKLGTTIPLATRDLIRDNAAKHFRDPASPEFGDLANATARSMREFWGDNPAQTAGGFFGGGKVLVPQSVVASVRKALDAGVDADKTYKTIAQRTGYTRKQIEAALNAQQSAR
jgi:hypothetical protein